MARPRKVSDETVFEAVFALMNRLGPMQWTLGDVAREVGVTPSALVQRFGSKRELQVALMDQWAGSTEDLFARLREQSDSPLTVLHAYADCIAQLGQSPAGLAHHLAYLQVDLTDPDMHDRLRRQAADARESICELLEEACRAGQLEGVADAAALARMVEVTLHGSLMVWGVYQEGTATASLRHDLDALLGPYLPQGNGGIRQTQYPAP
jgi:AcrR family transcriptional regulator